jgi:polyhydroxybutyrate depolymerase
MIMIIPRGIFHGSRQTGEAHRKFTGGSFDAMADSGAAVVVYLDGFKGNWNDSRRESFFPARLENIDDVAFTRAVIAELETTDRIDPRRVFAVGYSNGGQRAMRLVHEVGELLAGAAIFSATMPTPDSFIAPSPDTEVVHLPILLEQTDYLQDGHPPVRLLTVHGGGHTIPGPKKAPFILGRTHRGASAADLVAEFFIIDSTVDLAP